MKNESPMLELLLEALSKAQKATNLYLHSAHKVKPFDAERRYEPDDLEPYDALVSRFERTVEVTLRLFRSIERFETADTTSTVRDCLGLMCKLAIVGDVETWMQMREIRNRIAHDYVPKKIKNIYDLLTTAYRPVVESCIQAAEAYVTARRAEKDEVK